MFPTLSLSRDTPDLHLCTLQVNIEDVTVLRHPNGALQELGCGARWAGQCTGCRVPCNTGRQADNFSSLRWGASA